MNASDTQPIPTPVVFLGSDQFDVERVFPIRNLLADSDLDALSERDFRQTTSNKSRGASPKKWDYQDDSPQSEFGNGDGGEEGSSLRTYSSPPTPDPMADGFFAPPYPKIPPEDLIRPLSLNSSNPMPDSGSHSPRRMTERSQMVPHMRGAPGVVPGVVTGSEPTFHRCEDEPIHIPGAIQQFGALVAARYDEEAHLKVRIVSENTVNIIQHTPEALFAVESLLDILDLNSRDDFQARVSHALHHADDEAIETRLDCFTLSIITSSGPLPLWCAVHISKGTTDLVICEFEEYTTPIFHLDGLHSPSGRPPVPTHTVANEVTPEERLKSVTSRSQPLHVLQLARRRQNSALGSMEVFTAMTQVQQQLASAKTIQSVLDMTVGLVSELTGFHRVMLYRFDNKKNGCVVTELVDPKASTDIYRGLNFPASDIPEQARDLYMINRIRMLYDRDEETARFLGREQSDFDSPLDLTHSYLRAMSPIHLKYLINMGVRSTMSISLVINNDLWGLIACHHYGESGNRVSLPIRELCRNIGECASTNIERLLMLQRVQARKTTVVAPPQQNPSGFIAASSADLVKVFDADFGLLSIHGEARTIGRLDPYRESLALLAHLHSRKFTSIVASQNINADFPKLKYPPGIKDIAGLLVIPLSLDGSDFIVFFRKCQMREVRWAGNPYSKVLKPGSQYLEPRASFKRWTETVGGQSREWTEDQLDTASILSSIYGRFIEIWRQKESAAQNNRLTRLLLRNSSHEVRTPLNAIVNYLDIALEHPLDSLTKEVLEKAYKASRSLVYVIDDLLNLTKVEDSRLVAPDESFDLGMTVSDVLTPFRKEAMRKNLDLTVSTHPGIPEMVKGDPSRLRQIISNIIANAFQNSVAGGIKVDIRPIKIKSHSSIVGIRVQDDGKGMSEKQLDDLFQEFEQILDDEGKDSPISSSPLSDLKAPRNENPLGLGLAVVARYVRNMDGQIRVRSELGKGTIFGIELPFEHAPSTPETQLPKVLESSLSPTRFFTKRRPSPSYLTTQVRAASLGRRASLCTGCYTRRDTDESIDATSAISNDSPVSTPGDGYSTSSVDNMFKARIATNRGAEFAFDISPLPPSGPLSVLIAEDNPINARLLSRRLLKLGHTVELADDGQVCNDLYTKRGNNFDVILMDIQMPLVDGHAATRMIRMQEKVFLNQPQRFRTRIPIIAVSASLIQENRFEYIECGFDGWIMKPVDFSRLELLLRGIKDSELRRVAQYVPGMWEQGGWFLS